MTNVGCHYQHEASRSGATPRRELYSSRALKRLSGGKDDGAESPGSPETRLSEDISISITRFSVCSVTNSAPGLGAGPHVEGGKRQMFEDDNRLFVYC